MRKRGVRYCRVVIDAKRGGLGKRSGTGGSLFQIVIQSRSHPDRGLAVSFRVPGQSEPGSKVQLRIIAAGAGNGLHAGRKRQSAVRIPGDCSAKAIHLVGAGHEFMPEAQVQRQVRPYAPVILNEPADHVPTIPALSGVSRREHAAGQIGWLPQQEVGQGVECILATLAGWKGVCVFCCRRWKSPPNLKACAPRIRLKASLVSKRFRQVLLGMLVAFPSVDRKALPPCEFDAVVKVIDPVPAPGLKSVEAGSDRS